MDEVLTHAVDAPIANILVLAGILFLAISVLGKISGKIEPGPTGRVLSGILGAVLVAGGLTYHAASDQAAKQATAPAPDVAHAAPSGAAHEKSTPPERREPVANDPLVGDWRNQNPDTKGITRIAIARAGGGIQVHAWGKCEPKDCDWGTQTGTEENGGIRVNWDQGFVRREMTLTPDVSRLKAVVDNVYTDNRGSRELKEFFVR